MYLGHHAMLVINVITYVGHGGNDIHVELTVQALLHNFHVQQPQEAATEAEAQGYRRLGLEGEGSIVQLQFLQAGTQVFVVLGRDGIDTGKHHGLHLFKA